MGQALYRAHRPKSLDTVVGQEHITDTLKNSLKNGRISHAYLFTGPRGVGKTSIARILAHEINGLPYDEDTTHLDIIEIDAASNRRIDEIRELRDKVNIAPTSAKYKVYIIDEVHMLTREAFNALLKTLEEPPAHAVFILATTEVHKLPETIVSRTQRFTFKPVAHDQVVAHLRELAGKESITINDDALSLIARHGEGSFRDSISLLDQTRGYEGTVTLDTVRGMLGLPADEAVAELQTAADGSDPAAVARLLQAMQDQGVAAAHIAKAMSRRIREELLEGNVRSGYFALLNELSETPAAYEPSTQLELALLRYALRDAVVTAVPAQQPTPAAIQPAAVKPTPVAPAPARAAVAPPAAETKPAPEPAPAPQTAAAAVAPAGSAVLDESAWPQILGTLKQTHNTLYSVLRMGQPVFGPGTIQLRVKFGFHQKRLNDAKNQEVIIAAIRAVTGQSAIFNCVLDKDAEAKAVDPVAPAVGKGGDALSAISNVFGGGEVI